MKFINSWTSKVKQKDKVNIEIRISFITLFRLYFDKSNKEFRLTLLNYGISNK